LSEFGGFVIIIFTIISFIGTNINYNFLIGTLITDFYIYDQANPHHIERHSLTEDNNSAESSIEFTSMEMLN